MLRGTGRSQGTSDSSNVLALRMQRTTKVSVTTTTTVVHGETRPNKKQLGNLIEGPGGKRRLSQLGRAEGKTLALHRPQVYGVEQLIAGITRAVDMHGEAKRTVELVAKEVEKLVANPKALDPNMLPTDPARYTRTLLYRDPEKRFIVLALAWMPGQASPIHDHECWGAVGIFRGALAETRYNKGEQGLVRAESDVAKKGAVTTVNPPETDLHRMENASNEMTISIHVYGRDMKEANVYDEKTGAPTRKNIGFDLLGPLAREAA